MTYGNKHGIGRTIHNVYYAQFTKQLVGSALSPDSYLGVCSTSDFNTHVITDWTLGSIMDVFDYDDKDDLYYFNYNNDDGQKLSYSINGYTYTSCTGNFKRKGTLFYFNNKKYIMPNEHFKNYPLGESVDGKNWNSTDLSIIFPDLYQIKNNFTNKHIDKIFFTKPLTEKQNKLYMSSDLLTVKEINLGEDVTYISNVLQIY